MVLRLSCRPLKRAPELIINPIQGWRAEAALTPGYFISRLLRDEWPLRKLVFRISYSTFSDAERKDFSDFGDEDGAVLRIEDLLPSPDAGPEAVYVRSVLLDELELALDELPNDQPMSQREVFIAHELEGRSFKELSAESGVNINTLLARKRYAVLHLRGRLQSIHDEFTNK
jgi:DNA-directed RNA polymerase specialized sigma24 family protein